MGSGGIAPPFLPSALDGGVYTASCLSRFTPRERASGTHWIGGWIGPRIGLDAVEKNFLPLSGLEPWPLLYRLSYSGRSFRLSVFQKWDSPEV
jgi:hypothetical protein